MEMEARSVPMQTNRQRWDSTQPPGGGAKARRREAGSARGRGTVTALVFLVRPAAAARPTERPSHLPYGRPGVFAGLGGEDFTARAGR
jgi:hypothetical protein